MGWEQESGGPPLPRASHVAFDKCSPFLPWPALQELGTSGLSKALTIPRRFYVCLPSEAQGQPARAIT